MDEGRTSGWTGAWEERVDGRRVGGWTREHAGGAGLFMNVGWTGRADTI